MQEEWGRLVYGVGRGNSVTTGVRKVVSAFKEKDAALALLSDDLQNRDNQIQAIQYKKVALQAQRDAY